MGETVKVLVVDDDRRMVKTICDILNAKGFTTAAAFTGEDAVPMVKEERPDCVLMDVKMPGIDGVEALRMMKQLVPDIPVVLMSAFATGEQAEEAKKQGAYGILTKPIDISMLLSFLSILRKEECILVVDDDPLFCKTLKGVLLSRNYQVETEGDPEKVLALMEQKYELVVLLDLKLGDAHGLEVLKNIRKQYPSKPVVLVTGYREDMASTVEKGLQIGAYSCFYKPLQLDNLIAMIEEIRRKKLRVILGEPFEINGE
jgi:two-component system, NtrC family, response regulator HydG